MTALDLLLVAVFVCSVLYGAWRGVILQLGSVGAVAASVLACRVLTPVISDWIITDKSDPTGEYVDTVIINVVVFMIGYFGVRMLVRALHRMVTLLKLKPIDRIAGSIFSLFEWMLVLSLLLNLVNVMLPGVGIAGRSRLSDGRAITAVMDLAPDVLGGLNVSELMTLGDDNGKKADSDGDAGNKTATGIVINQEVV